VTLDFSKKGNPYHAMTVLLPALKGYVDLGFKYSTGMGSGVPSQKQACERRDHGYLLIANVILQVARGFKG
jgi:hypothetical protein